MSFPIRDAIRSAHDYAEETWGGERTGFSELDGAKDVLKRLQKATDLVTKFIEKVEADMKQAESEGIPYDAWLVRKHTGHDPRTSTLYKDIVKAGIPVDNHESDLYVKDTPEARALITKYGKAIRAFPNMQRNGEQWIDVPFAFEPFWEKKPR